MSSEVEPAQTKTWTMALEEEEVLWSHVIIGTLEIDEVVVKNVSNGSLSVANLATRTWNHTSNMEYKHDIYCCTLLKGRDVIICGTHRNSILIFDRKWEYLKIIRIQEEDSHESIHVSVDTDGKIIAAVHGGSTVMLFEPDNGRKLHVFDIQDGHQIEDLHALSSGDIAVLTRTSSTSEGILSIQNPLGVIKSTFGYPEKEVLSIAVDHERNLLYALYEDGHSNLKVDKISATGEIIQEKILEKGAMLSLSFAVNGGENPKFVTCDQQTLKVYEPYKRELLSVSESRQEHIGSRISLRDFSSQTVLINPKSTPTCKKVTELVITVVTLVIAIAVIVIMIAHNERHRFLPGGKHLQTHI